MLGKVGILCWVTLEIQCSAFTGRPSADTPGHHWDPSGCLDSLKTMFPSV